MMKDTPSTLVPKLRFPEFQDAGEWEEKKLQDVCIKIAQGGTPDTSNVDFWNGQVDWLTPSEMGKNGSRFINSTIRKITEKGLQNCSSVLMPKNSVIISTRAPIGHLAINISEMAINQGCKGLIPKELYDFNFLYYLLSKSKSYLVNLGSGNIFKELNGKAIKNVALGFPPPKEQRRIADCLSCLDDLIEAQGRKLNVLRDHKKGLMQKLFPQEGEAQPRLRFPEFQDAGAWEVNRLGDRDISKFIRDRIPSTQISLEDYVGTANLLPNFGGLSPIPELPPSNGVIAYKKGDILMSNIRPYLKKIWVSDKSGGASNDVLVARPSRNVSRDFLGHSLMSDRFIAHVMNGVKGVKMPRGDLEQIQDFCVPLPKHSEQRRIADCLTSLDDLIAAQARKLDTLKTHKKGLMQQLFPTPQRADASQEASAQ